LGLLFFNPTQLTSDKQANKVAGMLIYLVMSKEIVRLLENVEHDDFSCRNYSIYSIAEKCEIILKEIGLTITYNEPTIEYKNYGRKRTLECTVDQTGFKFYIIQYGNNGLYNTYFKYEPY
jgi:hypothetical protein